LAQNWFTDNTPGALEYYTGDPNAPGYREDHAGEKLYHDHLAFRDRDTTLKVKRALEENGIQVRGFGDRGGHAENSYHYTDQAIDIPGAQWGGSGPIGEREYAGSKRVREIVRSVLGGKGGGGGGGGVYAPPEVSPLDPGLPSDADTMAELRRLLPPSLMGIVDRTLGGGSTEATGPGEMILPSPADRGALNGAQVKPPDPVTAANAKKYADLFSANAAQGAQLMGITI
jgi:hypothetical protein